MDKKDAAIAVYQLEILRLWEMVHSQRDTILEQETILADFAEHGAVWIAELQRVRVLYTKVEGERQRYEEMLLQWETAVQDGRVVRGRRL